MAVSSVAEVSTVDLVGQLRSVGQIAWGKLVKTWSRSVHAQRRGLRETKGWCYPAMHQTQGRAPVRAVQSQYRATPTATLTLTSCPSQHQTSLHHGEKRAYMRGPLSRTLGACCPMFLGGALAPATARCQNRAHLQQTNTLTELGLCQHRTHRMVHVQLRRAGSMSVPRRTTQVPHVSTEHAISSGPDHVSVLGIAQ